MSDTEVVGADDAGQVIPGKAVVMNTTPVPVSNQQLRAAMGRYNPLIATMTQWTNRVTNGRSRAGNLLDRDRYVTPNALFDQIRLGRMAVDDDVVGNVAETTESLAFKRTSFSADDGDEEDVWNQWAGDVELDARLREMWNAMFTDSQVVVGSWWGTKDYGVRGKTDLGRQRRKQFPALQLPTALTVIDSLKVYPVGSFMFNQEQLAYIATPDEAIIFDEELKRRDSAGSGGPAPLITPADDPLIEPGGPTSDAIVRRLLLRRYEPSLAERRYMLDDGVSDGGQNLFLMNPQFVFRHTATRPQYHRFARVRLKSVFELLDLKAQLRHMDRTFLLAGAQFIILIRVGTDDAPALPEEVAHLQANARMIATVPLIVGDHRLQVDIITPNLEASLNRDRYDTLDARILSRLYRMLIPTGGGSAGQDPEKLGKVIGANLMSERHMMMRSLERNLFAPIVAANPSLVSRAKLLFHPAQIALEFDSAFASFLLDLRELREISRDTILSQFELDQAHEARMLEREAAYYDPIFKTLPPPGSPGIPSLHKVHPGDPARPTAQPAEPAPAATRVAKKRAGRRLGGNRGGGGAAPGTGQGKSPVRPRQPSDHGRGRARTKAELLEEATAAGIRGRSRMTAAELEEAIEAAVEDGRWDPAPFDRELYGDDDVAQYDEPEDLTDDPEDDR